MDGTLTGVSPRLRAACTCCVLRVLRAQNPFEVGDEITFFHNNKVVEGFVIDIGWYRTNLRSFEREVSRLERGARCSTLGRRPPGQALLSAAHMSAAATPHGK